MWQLLLFCAGSCLVPLYFVSFNLKFESKSKISRFCGFETSIFGELVDEEYRASENLLASATNGVVRKLA